MRCRPDEVVDKVSALLEERKQSEKLLKKLRAEAQGDQAGSLLDGAQTLEGFRLIAAEVEAENADALRNLGDGLRDKLGSGVAVLAAPSGDKLSFLCVVTDNLIKTRGLKAGDIVREVAKVTGGSGGGKPHQAMAGGKDLAKIGEALAAVRPSSRANEIGENREGVPVATR